MPTSCGSSTLQTGAAGCQLQRPVAPLLRDAETYACAALDTMSWTAAAGTGALADCGDSTLPTCRTGAALTAVQSSTSRLPDDRRSWEPESASPASAGANSSFDGISLYLYGGRSTVLSNGVRGAALGLRVRAGPCLT
jgi:hypothetical protein